MMNGRPTGYADYMRLMLAVSEARERLYAHLAGSPVSSDEAGRCMGALEALDRVLDYGAARGRVGRQMEALRQCDE